MKTRLLISAFLLGASALVSAATNDLSGTLQKGLFEEEANHNLGAAIQAYQAVVTQVDKDRKLAATAVFRLGECYRKQGNTNEANAQYQRVLREFPEQTILANLSRQTLATLGSAPVVSGVAPVSAAARQEQRRLFDEEIRLLEKKLENQQRQRQAGVVSEETLWSTQREILELKRKQAGLDVGQPAAETAGNAAVEQATLEAELSELKSLPKEKLRIAVQQNYPNPVLTSLMQKLVEVEQDLRARRLDYGPEHPEVRKALALEETINQQIDNQVEAVLKGLEIKRAAAAKAASALAGQPESVSGGQIAALPGAATPAEAAESSRIRSIIKNSPDLINSPEKNGETLLQAAAAKGNMAVARLLLENGAAVNGIKQPDLTPLHFAAGNGHKGMVDLLLSKGAKVDARTESGVTPLHLAALKGYEAVARTLVEAGASANTQVQKSANPNFEDLQYNIGAGQAALHLAAYQGYTAIIELLVSKGAEVNAVSSGGYTPLHFASRHGYPAIIELLVSKGAKVNAENDEGRTALGLAVEARHVPVVSALLAAKANPDAGSHNLPLCLAAWQGDLPVLELLLQAGADPNLKSDLTLQSAGVIQMEPKKSPPLYFAVKEKRASAVQLLTRYKANPNDLDPSGLPLLYAARSDTPTLKALLEGGADPNLLPEKSNELPVLCRAVLDRKKEAVELLLEYRADVNTPFEDGGGGTALQIAARLGAVDLAELLLRKGAEVGAQDKDGKTPLHWAVRDRKPAIIKLLLDNKADPNAQDNNGATPLDYAKQQIGSANLRAPGMPIIPQLPGGTVPSRNLRGESAQRVEDSPASIADTLREYGAVDDMPRPDRIELRRSSTRFSNSVFQKTTKDVNQFTLLELVGAHYAILAQTPYSDPGERMSYRVIKQNNFNQALPFPALASVRIRRPSADLKQWQDVSADLASLLESGDCAKDLPLKWGDVVEIPEQDHPLNELWEGFTKAQLDNFIKCLTRQVEIIISGKSTKCTLGPFHVESRIPMMPGQGPDIAKANFWLKPALLGSKLVLASSDLSRVKVTRPDPATGEKREWVFDCTEGKPVPELWLRDGDTIEVPERQ